MDQRRDAIEADPRHYRVLFENEKVRALRITFACGEKSEMHRHPPSMLVFLTDGQVRHHFPDGSARDFSFKAGMVQWVPATAHQPENTGSQPFELIQLELKDS